MPAQPLSDADLTDLIEAWSTAWDGSDTARRLLTQVRQGILDVKGMIAKSPTAPWFERTLARLAGSAPGHDYYSPHVFTSPSHAGSTREASVKALAQIMLDAGANPWIRVQDSGNKSSPPESVVVHYITLGWTHELRALLSRPDTPSIPELEATSPILLHALLGPKLETLEMLLEQGFSPHVLAPDGTPLLSHASRMDQVELLRRYGADLQQQSKSGQSVMDLWNLRLNQLERSPLQKLWVASVGVPNTLEERMDRLQASLPLDSVSRFYAALRNAGIKGPEVDSQGRSLLSLALRAIKQPAGNPDHGVLCVLQKKVQPISRAQPEVAIDLGLNLLTRRVMDIGQQFLQDGGVDFDQPATWPAPSRLARLEAEKDEASQNFSVFALTAATDDQKEYYWRPWVKDETQAALRRTHLLRVLAGSSAARRATVVNLLAKTPALMHAPGQDPWDVVFTALLSCSGLKYFRDKFDDMGLAVLKSHLSPAEPALARYVLKTNHPLTCATWDKWKPELQDNIDNSQDKVGNAFSQAFLQKLEKKVLQDHLSTSTPSAPKSRLRV